MTSSVLINADYQVLGVISMKKAWKLITKGKVVVVKAAETFIHTVSKSFLVPIVLRLVKLVRMIYGRKIPFSKRSLQILYNFTCGYCGVHQKSGLTIDHIVPKSRGGKSDYSNTVPCCLRCNNIKDNRLPSEAGMTLKYKVVVPTIQEFLQLSIKNLGLDGYLRELGL